MPNRDWDAELKKIDRRLEATPDEALLPAPKPATPAAGATVAEQRRKTSTLGVLARLVLVTLLGVGILFWPYSHQCGMGAAAYLAATSAIVAGGLWSSVWTWRHRTASAHVLSLLLVLWGLVLGAIELLPRTGYAKPDPARPTGWTCAAPVATTPAATQPAPATAPR